VVVAAVEVLAAAVAVVLVAAAVVLAAVLAGVVVAVAESPQAAKSRVRKVNTNTSHCDFKRVNFIK
jgi:hypothetical protein